MFIGGDSEGAFASTCRPEAGGGGSEAANGPEATSVAVLMLYREHDRRRDV